ncbi:uncharacterized protein LOC128218148 [Mya arenaria]|uniref:uncharacterized protein LOC128218148 n=1 Tax=Mya arenaria TaxID=6604 RepID=UPI0022E591CE|nr:uncharacterized protein LOC128218148 [Mya arenaria]
MESVTAQELPYGKDYHLFVCYTSANLHEVRTIVDNLENAGFKCCYHERDFTAGQSVLENINQSMNRSLHMLVILSEALSTQPYALHEIEGALHKRISDGYFIIPIRIEPCAVPDYLKSTTWIEASEDEIDEMHIKIIDAVVKHDIASGRKYPDNGKSEVFPLMTSGGLRSLSIPRFQLKLNTSEIQRRLWENGFQLSVEEMDDIERMVNGSFIVKHLHILHFFCLITMLIYVALTVGTVSITMLLVYCLFGDSPEEMEYGYTVVVVFSSVALPVWLVLSCGIGRIYGIPRVLEKGQEEIYKRLWKINSQYKTKNLFVLYKHEIRSVKIIKYNTKPCKIYLKRLFGKNEKLKSKLVHEHDVEKSIEKLFERIVRSRYIEKVDEMYGNTRHPLIGDLQCLCVGIEQIIQTAPDHVL